VSKEKAHIRACKFRSKNGKAAGSNQYRPRSQYFRDSPGNGRPAKASRNPSRIDPPQNKNQSLVASSDATRQALGVDVSALRQDYRSGELRRGALDPNPICQFKKWFDEACIEPRVDEANAMTLATSGAGGIVRARTVLLKGYDSEGFRFFTNYESLKATQIEENPRVALLFFWAPLERQVCIQGTARKTSREESEEYFRQRPLASRLGAWASNQSAPIGSREELESQYAEVEKLYASGDVPLPPNWGGYVVQPDSIEFWQGRTSRLHDRFRYIRTADGAWSIDRLSP